MREQLTLYSLLYVTVDKEAPPMCSLFTDMLNINI